MKKHITVLGFALCLVLAQPAAGWHILRCFTIPDNPAENTPFILCARGEFLTPGWALYYYCEDGRPSGSFPCNPAHPMQGNHISSTLYFGSLGGLWIQVVTPWEQYIYIDGLPRGAYSATVTFEPLPGVTGLTTARTAYFYVGPPPIFNSQTLSGTNLVLRWNGDTSFWYTIEYSTQLTANVWKSDPSYSYVDGTSNSMEYQMRISNGPPRMFRIRSELK